jgi:hypothetical protein
MAESYIDFPDEYESYSDSDFSYLSPGQSRQYSTDSTEASDFREMSEDYEWWQNALRGIKSEPASSVGNNVQFLNNSVSTEVKQIRNALLGSLHQNMRDVSAQLRYAYLTDQEAIQRGMNLAAIQKLRKVRDKLVKIYQNFGGYEDSIRKAILMGLGNGYSNFVFVEAGIDNIYADQQEYNVLHDENSRFDNWEHLPFKTKELIDALHTTLKTVIGLFGTASIVGSDSSSQQQYDKSAMGSVPASGNTTTNDQSKENKNVFELAVDWIKANPGKTILIGGGIALGGYAIIKYLEEQKKLKPRSLQGLNQSPSKRSKRRKRYKSIRNKSGTQR